MKYRLATAVLLLCLSTTAVWAQGTPTEPEDTRQTPFTFLFKGNTMLKLYGAIDMLTYYDTTSPAISDWLAFVYPKGTLKGDEDSFNMAVRASKIGIFFQMPEALKGWDVSAKLEADFVGGFSTGSTVAYSPLMRLKQAWVSLDSKHVSFLVGQTFGAFGPLFPSVGSWIALGTSGNPWIRLPQIKTTLRYAPFTLELSATRPMAANTVVGGSQDDIISDGEYSNMPFFMGRLGYADSFGPVSISAGVSGAYGKEKILRIMAADGVDINKTLDVWMGIVDLKVATKWVAVSGEGFMGSNLNTFYAGIIQGVTIDMEKGNAKGIRAWGAWGQLTILPESPLNVNLGGGIDDPDDNDLLPNARAKNIMAYGNVNYALTKNWRLSLEGSYMQTSYKAGEANDNIRSLFRSTFSF